MQTVSASAEETEAEFGLLLGRYNDRGDRQRLRDAYDAGNRIPLHEGILHDLSYRLQSAGQRLHAVGSSPPLEWSAEYASLLGLMHQVQVREQRLGV